MHYMNHCQEMGVLFNGLLEIVANMIGIKQGFPLSPTIFNLCIDEIFNYIDIGKFRSMLNRDSHTDITKY